MVRVQQLSHGGNLLPMLALVQDGLKVLQQLPWRDLSEVLRYEECGFGKGVRELRLYAVDQPVGTDENRPGQTMLLGESQRLVGCFVADSGILCFHAMLEQIVVRTTGFQNALTAVMPKVLLLPLRSVDLELLLGELRQVSERVCEEADTMMVDNDDSVGFVFIPQSDELPELRCSPVELILDSDLQGNEPPGFGSSKNY